AVGDGAHTTDGDAARKEAAGAGADDEIADLDASALTRHVLQPDRAARIALDDARCARAHDVRAHGGRRIREDLDDGRAAPHLEDAADQAFGRDHRGETRDVVAAAAIDRERAHPAAPLARDDLRADGLERQPLLE